MTGRGSVLSHQRDPGLLIGPLALVAISLPALPGGASTVWRTALVAAATSLAGTGIWFGLSGSRFRPDVITVIGIGTAIGTAVIGFLALPLRGFDPAAPLAATVGLSAVAVGLRRLRDRADPPTLRLPHTALATTGPFAVGLMLGSVPLLLSSAAFPVTSSQLRPYHDLVFLQALTDSIATTGLGSWPNAAGVPIRYHWLSYAWLGSLDRLLDGPTMLPLARIAPTMALTAVVALVVDVARRSRIRARTAPLVAVLVLFGGAPIGGAIGSGVVVGVPSLSMSMGVVWSLALLTLITDALQGRRAGFPLALPALLGSAVCLGKIHLAIVVAGGLVAAALAGSLTSAPWSMVARRVTVAVALGMLAVFLPFQALAEGTVGLRVLDVAQLLQFSGANATTLQLVAGGVAVLAFVVSRFGGQLLVGDRAESSFWFAAGSTIVGLSLALVIGDGISFGLVLLSGAAVIVIPLQSGAIAQAVDRARIALIRAAPGRRAMSIGALLTASGAALALRRSPDTTLIAGGAILGVAGCLLAAALVSRREEGRRHFAVALAATSLITGGAHLLYMSAVAVSQPERLGRNAVEVTTVDFAAGAAIRARAGDDDLLIHPGGCTAPPGPSEECIGLDATPLLASGLPALVSVFGSSSLPDEELLTRLRFTADIGAGTMSAPPEAARGRTLWVWLDPGQAGVVATGLGGEIVFMSDEVAVVRVDTSGE